MAGAPRTLAVPAAIGAALVFAAAACQPAASPGPASAPAGASASTTPPVADEVNLFGTAYAPEEGVAGGQLVVGYWQEAQSFNPFYVTQVTEANVAAAAWATLVR